MVDTGLSDVTNEGIGVVGRAVGCPVGSLEGSWVGVRVTACEAKHAHTQDQIYGNRLKQIRHAIHKNRALYVWQKLIQNSGGRGDCHKI